MVLDLFTVLCWIAQAHVIYLGVAALVHLYVDDFPDFILEGFRDHRRAWGKYPRVLWVTPLLAEVMHCRPGLWRPTVGFVGVWGWVKYLKAGAALGKDEFGRPD